MNFVRRANIVHFRKYVSGRKGSYIRGRLNYEDVTCPVTDYVTYFGNVARMVSAGYVLNEDSLDDGHGEVVDVNQVDLGLDTD